MVGQSAEPVALEVLFESVAFAQDIGASLFNIHLYQDQGIAAYVQAIIPLIDRLASARIKLAIENTPLTGPADFNELFSQLEKTSALAWRASGSGCVLTWAMPISARRPAMTI